MALMTQADIIADFPQYNAKLYPIIEGYRPEAEEVLRGWIGDAKYDDIAADTAHQYRARAVRAETLLTVMVALPDLNRRLTNEGGHVRQLGTDPLGNTNSLMGKTELDAYAANLYNRARSLVRRIIRPSIINNRDDTFLR